MTLRCENDDPASLLESIFGLSIHPREDRHFHSPSDAKIWLHARAWYRSPSEFAVATLFVLSEEKQQPELANVGPYWRKDQINAVVDDVFSQFHAARLLPDMAKIVWNRRTIFQGIAPNKSRGLFGLRWQQLLLSRSSVPVYALVSIMILVYCWLHP